MYGDIEPRPYEDARQVQQLWQQTIKFGLFGRLFLAGTEPEIIKASLDALIPEGPERIGPIAIADAVLKDATYGDIKLTVFNGSLSDAEQLSIKPVYGPNFGREKDMPEPVSSSTRRALGALAIGSPIVAGETIATILASHEIGFDSAIGTLTPSAGLAAAALTAVTSYFASRNRQARNLISERKNILKNLYDVDKGGIRLPQERIYLDITGQVAQDLGESGEVPKSMFKQDDKISEFAAKINYFPLKQAEGTENSPQTRAAEVKGRLDFPWLLKNVMRDIPSEHLHAAWHDPENGLYKVLSAGQGAFMTYFEARAAYEYSRSIHSLTDIEPEDAHQVFEAYNVAQGNLVRLAGQIITVHKNIKRELHIEEMKNRVAAFGNPETEAQHRLKPELDAFKSVVYSALLDREKDADIEKTIGGIGRYFSQMNTLIRSTEQLEIFYQGMYDKFSSKIDLPKWQDVADRIKRPASMTVQ